MKSLKLSHSDEQAETEGPTAVTMTAREPAKVIGKYLPQMLSPAQDATAAYARYALDSHEIMLLP